MRISGIGARARCFSRQWKRATESPSCSPACGAMRACEWSNEAMSAFPVAEPELQAYVDARADPARRAAIDGWLAAHPDDAARVAAYRQLGERCREAYASVLEEPIPHDLLAALQERPRRRSSRFAGAFAAAFAAAALVVLGFAAWLLFAEADRSEIVQRAA